MPASATMTDGWITSGDRPVVHRPTVSCANRQAAYDGSWTVHRTAGTLWGFWSRWQAGAGSAHFVIDVNGSITQCVSILQTAWHSGDWGWNQHSMSVELECRDVDNALPPTDAQFDALFWLTYAVENLMGVPLRSMNLHRDIVQTTCPGDVGVNPLRDWENKIIGAGSYTGGITVGSGPARGTVTEAPVGARVLGQGDSGPDVAEWQSLLAQLGYGTAADGDFGLATDRDTRAFQGSVPGLGVDGLVGDRTRAAAHARLAPTTPPPSAPGTPGTDPSLRLLSSGTTGDDVEQWKRVLADAGLTVGDPPNTFGDVTRASTRQGQVWFGVADDGVVGPDTRRAFDTRTQFVCRGLPLFLSDTLRVGSGGPLVAAFQQRLLDRGWAIDVDGNFGPQTDGIARQFATEKGVTYDGVTLEVFTKAWSEPITR